MRRRVVLGLSLLALASVIGVGLYFHRYDSRAPQASPGTASGPRQAAGTSIPPTPSQIPSTSGSGWPTSRAYGDLRYLVERDVYDEDLFPGLVVLEDEIARQDANGLRELLDAVLSHSMPDRLRAMVLVAFSASSDPLGKELLLAHLSGQDALAVAFCYSLVLGNKRLGSPREQRHDFWKCAFLTPGLGELLAPDYIRRFHAKSLGLSKDEALPAEAFDTPIGTGNTLQKDVVKPSSGRVKTGLLSYLARGSSAAAAGEIVFLLPWDSEFAPVAGEVFEDASRDHELRMKVLAGYTQSSGPELLNHLLSWANNFSDPDFIQNIATGLAIQGVKSGRKAEAVLALQTLVASQVLDAVNVNSILSNMLMMNAPEGVKALSDLVKDGPTKEVQLAAIQALGANSGTQTTVQDRADQLIFWNSSTDHEVRRGAEASLYALALNVTNSPEILAKVIAEMNRVQESSLAPADRTRIAVMLEALQAKAARLKK